MKSIRDSYASIESRLDDAGRARWQKFFTELEEVRAVNKAKDVEKERFLLRTKNGLHRFDTRDLRCECGLGFYDYHQLDVEQKTGPCPSSNYSKEWRKTETELPAEVEDLILEGHRYPLVDRVATRLSRLELSRATMRHIITRLRLCQSEWFAKSVWNRILTIRSGDFVPSEHLKHLADDMTLDIKAGL